MFAGTPVETTVLKGLLEDAGIAAFLKDEMMGGIAPWYVAPGGAGAVKVVIANADVAKAAPIVLDFLDLEPGSQTS